MSTPLTASPGPIPVSPSSLESIYAPIADELAQVQTLYRETILKTPEGRSFGQLLSENDGELDELFGGEEMLERVSSHLMRAQGKWHRPALTLLAARMWGERCQSARQVATSVELIHLATLVHDDIIDGAAVRRGQASVCGAWGNSVAVLMGDYLFSKAFSLLLASGSVASQNSLLLAVGKMCFGEINQLRQVRLFETTEQEYLETIANKTAALMASATAAGGFLAGAEEAICERLDHLGYSLGMAFQITDDLLDYRSNVHEMGKEAGGDLRNGKLTLPLIHLIREYPEIRDRIQTCAADRDAMDRLHLLMTENGSYDYALEMARRFLDDARDDLRELRKQGGAQDCLDAFELFLDFILSREK